MPRLSVRRFSVSGVAAFSAALALPLALYGGDVSAQEVSKSGKGVIGCALLGSELVVIGEAIAGVNQSWLYWTGAGVGLVGGAIGGYYLEPHMTPQTAVLSLMGGMALSIPALIVALDASRRHWPDAEPREPDPEPSNPPDPGARRELVLLPFHENSSALLRWSSTGIAVQVPDVYLTDTFTTRDRWAFVLPAATSYQVPLLQALF
jgi:hypothetical protein